MNTNRHLPLPARSIVAVLLVLVCVMFFMEWANVAFRDSGFSEDFVFYASRIAGLPVLTFLVWLIVLEQRAFVTGLFSKDGLTCKIVVTGILIGLLARVFSWSLITARAAFGILPSSKLAPPQEFRWGYECPELALLVMAILVWCILIPVTEEFIHRGVLQSAFANRGPVFAVAASAFVFMLMHPPHAYPFVFAFGIVFGVLYWNSNALWAPVLAHATYDGLRVFDSTCLRVAWNPAQSDVPLLSLGLTCTGLVLASVLAIVFLISKRWIGPQ